MNQRVVIVGRPGTGKTTLAIDLAANWEGDWVWVDTIREFAKWDKKKLLERFEQDKIKKIWKLEQLESRLTNFFMDQARKFILRTPRRIIFFPLAGTDKLLLSLSLSDPLTLSILRCSFFASPSIPHTFSLWRLSCLSTRRQDKF